MKYIVITHVCDGDYGDGTLVKKLYGKTWYDEPPTFFPPLMACKFMPIKQLAFHPGELLICNNDGRELAYPQRKPDKWYCRYREFSSLKKALALAVSITEEYDYGNRHHPEPKTDQEWDVWENLNE